HWYAYNWYTLGVAHYRAGDWEAAIAALDKHRELNGGGDAHDWLFLAMAHRKLGHAVESQDAYEQALRLLEQINKQLSRDWEQAEGLSHVRREAEEVLGLKKQYPRSVLITERPARSFTLQASHRPNPRPGTRSARRDRWRCHCTADRIPNGETIMSFFSWL